MTRRHVAVGSLSVVVLLLLVGGCGLGPLSSELPAGEYPDVDFRGVEDRFAARHVGERIRMDRCEPGQDNFETRDQYAFACRMRLAPLVPVEAPFKRNASALGEALVEGAFPNGTDTGRELAKPFDDTQLLGPTSGDCNSRYGTGGPEIEAWLSMRPAAGEIDLVTARAFRRCEFPTYPTGYCAADRMDLRAATSNAPARTAWLAVVVASKTYTSWRGTALGPRRGSTRFATTGVGRCASLCSPGQL